MKGYEIQLEGSTHRVIVFLHKSDRALNAMLKKRDATRDGPAWAFCEKIVPNEKGVVAHIHVNGNGSHVMEYMAHESLHAAKHIVELRGTDKPEEEEELASWTGKIMEMAMTAFARYKRGKRCKRGKRKKK